MNEVSFGLMMLLLTMVSFLTGIDLAFAMIIMGFIGFGYLVSWSAAFNLLAKDFYDVLNSYGFTVIPLFVLMGQISFNSGIAKRLFDAAHKFFGHIPGGLAIASVVGATVFKAICGSSAATSATFAFVAVPEMDRYRYDKRLSTGVVATVGTLGILLPPSVTLIIYGIITDLSIGRLFLAGIFPGLLIAVFFIFIIYGWCKIDPTIGPQSQKYSWSDRIKTVPEVLIVMVIFFLVIGGILGGFFTPTEAGSVGTFLVLVLSLFRKDITFKGFILSTSESVRTGCMVMMLITGSTILGHFIAVTKIPMITADWIVGLSLPSSVILVFISIIYLIGGSFIDDLAFMILATPIFYPAIIKLGYDPLWFGILISITIMMGVVIPPMAICVFVVKQITKTPFSVVYAGVYPFLIALLLGGIIIFLIPQIATWLPSVLMPN